MTDQPKLVEAPAPQAPPMEELVPGVRASGTLAEKIRICAQAAWEASRAVAIRYGQKVRPWPNAPQAERDEAIRDFIRYLAGASPEGDHERFVQQLLADGWTLGEKHSEVLRTHPALVPYWQLPEHVRAPGLVYWQVGRVVAAIFGIAVRPPAAPGAPGSDDASAGEAGVRG